MVICNPEIVSFLLLLKGEASALAKSMLAGETQFVTSKSSSLYAWFINIVNLEQFGTSHYDLEMTTTQ